MIELQRQALSRDNPWPGLDPFDETDQDYFHGRTAESGELLRLVRREPLTVLFGRSGLGKTSLLKAGLFPLLRGEDCLPVYVRLDHADGAPALREQIFRGLQTACDADRVQAAQPASGESLWSFFHRRAAEFWSDRNRPVTPVVVFDQFEEIFTLGQESEASRDRSSAFLAELGDLVESRPPDAVRQALEAEPTAARRFDFKRSTVKLVLSFREEFLAEMEGLKEQMATLAGHKDEVTSVAFSPDGKRLASGSYDKTVILWDVDGRKPLATLEGHKSAVRSVAFNPDGKLLASANLDNTVSLWDVDSRKPLATLEGHKEVVLSVTFSPDGKWLASASADQTVILWDVESRKPLATLEGHRGEVQSVAFSPDGRRLASACLYDTVILWDLDLGVLMAEACRTANRNLTCEEWRTYVGVDKRYRKTCEMLPGPEKCD